MQKKTFWLAAIILVAIFAVSPIDMAAKKIEYSPFITYNGKVNADKNPFGFGTLETVWINPTDGKKHPHKDILTGQFDGFEVSEATLLFDSIDGAKGKSQAKFSGKLRISINSEGGSITYSFIEGEFQTGNDHVFKLKPEMDFKISRVPHENRCDLTNIGLLELQEAGLDITLQPEFIEYFNPEKISEYGIIKNAESTVYYNITDDFSVIKHHAIFTAELEDGALIRKKDNTIIIDARAHEDFFKIDNNSTTYSFRKTYLDGILSYSDGKYYDYVDNEGETGFIKIDKQITGSALYKKIMNCTTIQQTGFKVYKNHIEELIDDSEAGNSNAQYELGIAYLNGEGVEKNPELADQWIRKAAENGNPDAIAKLEADEQAKKEDAIKKAKAGIYWNETTQDQAYDAPNSKICKTWYSYTDGLTCRIIINSNGTMSFITDSYISEIGIHITLSVPGVWKRNKHLLSTTLYYPKMDLSYNQEEFNNLSNRKKDALKYTIDTMKKANAKQSNFLAQEYLYRIDDDMIITYNQKSKYKYYFSEAKYKELSELGIITDYFK